MVVMLLPARTDTRWYHGYICSCDGFSDKYGRGCNSSAPGVEIRHIKGRLKFVDLNNSNQVTSAPFPSMVVIFKSQYI